MTSNDPKAAAGPHPAVERLLEIYQAGMSFRDTIDAILATLAEGEGWDAAALWMSDHHGHSMVCAGVWAAGPTQQPFADETANAALPIDASTLGRCWRTGEPIWIDDIERAEGFARRDLVLRAGLCSVALLPVLRADVKLGVLEFLGSEISARARRRLVLVEQTIHDLAGLLETQIEAEQMRRQQSSLDLALSAGRMGTWEWDRRTGHIAWSPTMERIYGFEPGTFPGTMEAYQSRIHPDDLGDANDALAATVADGRDHHVLHRIVLDSGEVRWIEGHGRPLTVEGIGFVGLTGVAMDVTQREQLLADLAHQVELTELALADRSLVADTLQRSLLPDRLPDVDGLELASGFRPGRELVGGDFFDVSRHGDDVYLCLGDVCGSGAEAAALTGLARYAVRGMVASGILAPSEIVEQLNDVLLAEEQEDRFVTLVLVRLTPGGSTWRAEICRAGHPLPIVRRSGAPARLFASSAASILGVFPEVHLADQQLTLDPGDTLVLYTDGITEARRDHELFGEDRLVGVVDGGPAGVHDLVTHVLGALDDFDRGSSHDDVALLAARVLGDR